MPGYFVYNPKPGEKVQCPNCSEHVTVGGRALHRWVDCDACGHRTEWHEQETAAGVICKCGEGFCPAHGKTKKLHSV